LSPLQARSITQTLTHPPDPHPDATDKELERVVAQKARDAPAHEVTTTSSIRIFDENDDPPLDPEGDMLGGLKRELVSWSPCYLLTNPHN